MTLRLPEPPAGALDLVRDSFGRLLTASTPLSRSLSRAPTEAGVMDWSAAAPHPVYFVSLDDVALGRVLASPSLTGWRYILFDADAPRLAAELSAAEAGAPLSFSHFNEGPYVEGLVAAVAIAEGLESVRGGDYELRLLTVPSLYLDALWLSGADDLFIPLGPAPGALDPSRAYTEDELMDGLRELVDSRLATRDEELPWGEAGEQPLVDEQ